MSEAHTADWLAGRSVIATRDDLLLAIDSIERAGRIAKGADPESPRLLRTVGIDLSR